MGPEPLHVLEGDRLGLLAVRPPQLARAWARGGLDLREARPAVAIVGARLATAAGLQAAREIARQLAAVGVTVISGGAVGVDREAHLAALRAGGKTVAVLGDPASRHDTRRSWMRAAFDPARDRALALTPFGPEVPHHRALFAARNHFIAALADDVVVVEGREQSGTLYTARAAGSLGVRLWACCGTTPASYVPCRLVEQGKARVLLPWLAAERIAGRPAPEEDHGPVVRAIRAAGGRLLVEEAARATRLGVPALLGEAARLEVKGLLRREGPFLVA